MSNNLTTNKVSQTYGRLVQHVSGDYFDGFGNELPIRKYWGSFYDTTIQTNAGSTYSNIISFDSIDFQDGVTIENGTDIKLEFGGIYNIQFSLQVEKTDAGEDDIEIWLKKNGVNVDDSTTLVTLNGNNAKAVAAWNFFVDADAGDYFQLAWHSNDLNIRILSRPAQSNPTRPAIPSIILTVNKIS